jgi:hypothetical protein
MYYSLIAFRESSNWFDRSVGKQVCRVDPSLAYRSSRRAGTAPFGPSLYRESSLRGDQTIN